MRSDIQPTIIMKAAYAFIVLALGSAALSAQPRVNFANNNTSLVTVASSGLPVVPSNGLVVALYAAPDGVTDESQFTLISSSNAPVGALAGRFTGGYVYVPTAPCSSFLMLQYRAFEPTFGSTYEAALTAPPANGRYGLVGKSAIGRLEMRCTPTVPRNTWEALGAFSVAPGLTAVALFTVNDIVVTEGSNGIKSATFTVQSGGGSTNSTRWVDFSTGDGTALAGSDYVATNGTLTFAPGEITNAHCGPSSQNIPRSGDGRPRGQVSRFLDRVMATEHGVERHDCIHT